MIQYIKDNFIPYAGQTERLQWRDFESGKWFMKMTEQIQDPTWKKVRTDYMTVQGLYFGAADGTSLGFSWLADKDSVLQELRDAQTKFNKTKFRTVKISDKQIEEDQPEGPDSSTSVIRLFYRCHPLPKDAHEINKSLGRDTMWIFKNEVEELATKAEADKVWVSLPNALTGRLVRFQLLDNVRGVANAWAPNEVTKATFQYRRLGQKERGKIGVFELKGSFGGKAIFSGDENYKGEMGVDGKVAGTFEIDLSAMKIIKWRAYASGEAWGANSNTWHQPKGRYPLAIAMVEATDPLSKSVLPMWYKGYGNDTSEYLQAKVDILND